MNFYVLYSERQRSGFERLRLGNNDRDALFPQNQVRAALPDGKKPQTLQGSCGLRPVDIARQFHATARVGSSTQLACPDAV